VPNTATLSFNQTAKDVCESHYVDPCCVAQSDPSNYQTGSCVGGCDACAYTQKSDGTWHCASASDSTVYGCPFAKYELTVSGASYLLSADPPQVGDPITVMPRGYPHAVMVVSSTEVTLQGISAYGSTNMGILENGGQGANEYIDDTVSPRPDSGHLIGVNADGLHVVGSAVGPKVTGATVEFTGDDLLNITPRIMMILSVSGTQMIVLDPGSHTSLLSSGDILSIYSAPTGSESISSLYHGSVTLAATPVLTDTGEAQSIIDTTESMCSFVTGHQTSSYFQTKYVYTLTLAEPPAGDASVCNLIQDISKADYGPEVTRSSFESSYARAALLKCDAEVIADSSYGYAGGIWAGIETQWLEGSLGFGTTPTTLSNLVDTELGLPWLNFEPGASCADVVLRGTTSPGVCPVEQ